MKTNILKYTFFALLGVGFATACTDNFENLNTDKHAATDEDMARDGKATGAQFQQMLNRLSSMKIGGDQDDEWASTGSYQHQIGISIDAYSGYIGPTAGWARGRYNGTYNFGKGDEWGNALFKFGMVQIMPAWSKMRAKAIEQNQPQIAALADVSMVFGMHRVTDAYGPLPIVDYKLGTVGAAYDAQDKIYEMFFEMLDKAIDELTPYALAGNTFLADFDPIYFGDVNKWVKFANTLRLRLALRVVYANPTLARTEAEKSAACPVGFAEAIDDRAEYKGLPNAAAINPIWQQAYEWNENRMSAPMDSYLNGYNDPRISKYFVAAADDGKFHGVRQGVLADGANTADYTGGNISNVNLSENSPVLFMAAAESYFLRAEAALRGWSMGGTAKDFYEGGIKMSFQETGAGSATSYLADATSTPAAFVDNSGKGDDMVAPSDITIAWNNDDSFEKNLERIITQKWIASWGNSCEAWSEFRRTGYPKLFPVKYNYSDGAVDTDLQIRRLPYPRTEYNTNRDAVTAAAAVLGGADNCGTKLWWDKNPNH